MTKNNFIAFFNIFFFTYSKFTEVDSLTFHKNTCIQFQYVPSTVCYEHCITYWLKINC